MKKMQPLTLIICLSLLSINSYSQNCFREVTAFDAAPGGYSISGTALLESDNNVTTLSFDNNFGTQSGPDLHVYLAINFEAPSEPGNTNVDLGLLTDNNGAQSYAVPSDVELDEFDYVLIHCKGFNHWWGGGLLGGIECVSATEDANEAFSKSIYPNPSNGILHFPEMDNQSQLLIFDLSGKLISKQSEGALHPLDMSHLGSAVFILKLINDKGTSVAKVIID